jgi:hypothetical protein
MMRSGVDVQCLELLVTPLCKIDIIIVIFILHILYQINSIIILICFSKILYRLARVHVLF